jgi:hypothetical protein
MTFRAGGLAGALAGVLALGLLAMAQPATAQVTPEQQSAIRGSCRGDFQAKCSSVTPGGPEALACLQNNVAGLSPACKLAVSATIAPAATPAVAKPAVAKPAVAKPVVAKPAVAKPIVRKPAKPVAAKPAAAPPVTAEVDAPPAGPTEEQLSAVKFTCRSDFSHHCGGVTPGGPEALVCLHSHEAQLSQDCKTSVADIADFIAAPAVAVPAAVVVPAKRKLKPPGLTPAGRVVRRVIKREEAK